MLFSFKAKLLHAGPPAANSLTGDAAHKDTHCGAGLAGAGQMIWNSIAVMSGFPVSTANAMGAALPVPSRS